MSATIHPFQSFARSASSLLILALLLVGSIPASPADEADPWFHVKVIRKYLGHVNHRYWFVLTGEQKLPVRVWAYDDRKAVGGRIAERTEFDFGFRDASWDYNAERFLLWAEGGRKIRSLDLSSGKVVEITPVNGFSVPGSGNMMLVPNDNGVEVVTLKGKHVSTIKSPPKDCHLCWLGPSLAGLQNGWTRELTIADALSGEFIKYTGIENLSHVGGGIWDIDTAGDEPGRAIRKTLTAERYAVFDSTAIKPAPFDPKPFVNTPNDGLRAQRLSGSDPVLGYYDFAGNLAFEFWTGFRPGSRSHLDFNYEYVNLTVSGDEILRIDRVDASLWIYDRKTAVGASGFALANIVSHSPEAVDGSIGMLYANGCFIRARADGTVLGRGCVPVKRDSPLSVFCFPHNSSPDSDAFVVWNGEAFYRIGFLGEITKSPYQPPAGSIVEIDLSEPYVAVATPRTGNAAQDGGTVACSVYKGSSLFADSPRPIMDFAVDGLSDLALPSFFRFWGDSGVLEAAHRRFVFREPHRDVMTLPGTERRIMGTLGSLVFYRKVEAQPRREGRVTDSVFDFSVGQTVYDGDNSVFGDRFPEFLRFPSLPGLVFYCAPEWQFLRAYALQECWEGGQPFALHFNIRRYAAAIFWGDGLSCLSSIGTFLGPAMAPQEISSFSARWKEMHDAPRK